MACDFVFGDLVCSLFEEYRALYKDDELAALAAGVELNEIMMRFDVHEFGTDHEYDEYFVFGPDSSTSWGAHQLA